MPCAHISLWERNPAKLPFRPSLVHAVHACSLKTTKLAATHSDLRTSQKSNVPGTKAPHVQGKHMDKHLANIRPKFLQNEGKSTLLGHMFVHIFALSSDTK